VYSVLNRMVELSLPGTLIHTDHLSMIYTISALLHKQDLNLSPSTRIPLTFQAYPSQDRKRNIAQDPAKGPNASYAGTTLAKVQSMTPVMLYSSSTSL